MNIYFSGIGGVGIGPLAQIALDAGFLVAGSDPADSLMIQQLQQQNVPISHQQDGTFLRARHAEQPIEWLVHTAALPADHPELATARELGIKTAKRDELLARIIAEKHLKLIAIAGTHGKTATTGMMVWTLKQLGVPVSYSVGTTLSWGPSGHYDPDSEYFVYECDEFDRNFLHFHPHLSLITTVEHDHIDIYPSAQEYLDAFSQFSAQSHQVITWRREINGVKLPDSAWILDDDEVQDIALAGEHNRRNATLVVKGIEWLKIVNREDDKKIIQSTLATFPGTNRRFERLADNLYTDYGHTPSEIKATLQMAREIADRVVLVYQPHQNIRQHEIRNQYTDDIFRNADEIYWLPTYLSRENPDLEILTPEQLTAPLVQSTIHVADMDDTLWQAIKNARHDGALVLMMGAGTIDGWVRQRTDES